MRVDDYVSKTVIERWLENYHTLEGGEAVEGGSGGGGPKSQDGVSNGRLNKIMLDDAIKRLSPLKRAVITLVYIRGYNFAQAARKLEVSDSIVRTRERWAIQDIYAYLNGEKMYEVQKPANHKALLAAINKNA